MWQVGKMMAFFLESLEKHSPRCCLCSTTLIESWRFQAGVGEPVKVGGIC